MTDTTTAAIEAMMKDATPAPWFQGGVNGGGKPTMVYSDDASGSAVADTVFQFVTRIDRECEANASFIAWCRKGVPALAAERDSYRSAWERADTENNQNAAIAAGALAKMITAEADRDAAVARAEAAEAREAALLANNEAERQTLLRHNARHAAEVADLKASVVAFCAPWAVQYAEKMGLAPGELMPGHYDILKDAGARMNDFTRAALAKIGGE